MIKFHAVINPVGHEGYDDSFRTPLKTITTEKMRSDAIERVCKMLMKYRLPYDMRTVDGFTLIEVTGEAVKRTVTHKPKPKPATPAQPEIICTRMESGRYEWHYTKTGNRTWASFPYCPERDAQMKKELQRDIDNRMKSPQWWNDSYNANNRGMR